VRVPDRPLRRTGGNSICTAHFENFGRVPVIRRVCRSCGDVKTGWKAKAAAMRSAGRF